MKRVAYCNDAGMVYRGRRVTAVSRHTPMPTLCCRLRHLLPATRFFLCCRACAAYAYRARTVRNDACYIHRAALPGSVLPVLPLPTCLLHCSRHRPAATAPAPRSTTLPPLLPRTDLPAPAPLHHTTTAHRYYRLYRFACLCYLPPAALTYTFCHTPAASHLPHHHRHFPYHTPPG